MGPTIILDKSAIQSFSDIELFFLTKYYTFNIVPNLYSEILGDYAKKFKENTSAESQVVKLALKINQNNAGKNIHYSVLMINEMMGNVLEMGYRTVIQGTKLIEREDGKLGVISEPSQEEDAFERWKTGNLTDSELEEAESYRKKLSEVDLEILKNSISHLKQKIKKPDNIEQVAQLVDALFVRINSDESDQFNLLEAILEMVKTPEELKTKIIERWTNEGYKMVQDFAPYSLFVYRTFMIFLFCLSYEFIGTRKSNLIDLEYLFYLPFCTVFCSGDKLHQELYPLYSKPEQDFVTSIQLKEDLRAMSQEWMLIQEPFRKQYWQEKYGNYPPQDSLTDKLWTRWRNAMKSVKTDDGIDFLTIERNISIESFCPCGSGKKFKNCCLSKINK